MTTLYRILVLAALVSAAAGCTAPIELPVKDSPPVIVIYGCLTDIPGRQSVQISSSSPYFDTQPNAGVSGAVVTITSSKGDVLALAEDPARPGTYRTEQYVAGVAELDYHLNVRVDFDGDGVTETYTATATMLSSPPIDSVSVRSFSMMGQQRFAARIYALDPPTEDYYLPRFWVNGTLVTDRISRYSAISDLSINGQYVDGMIIEMFPDADHPNPDDENYNQPPIKVGDRVTLHFSRIDKGYYNFIRFAQDEKNGESPFFGGPASNIPSNITGGAVGYFTAYAHASASTVVRGN